MTPADRSADHSTTTQNQGPVRSSSSALCALSYLAPPSPILVASELGLTCTSGEIPILFQTCSIPSSLDICGSPSESGSLSRVVASSSAETVDTMCTFGPIPHNFGLTSATAMTPPRISPRDRNADLCIMQSNCLHPDGPPEPSSPTPCQCARQLPLARVSACLECIHDLPQVDLLSDAFHGENPSSLSSCGVLRRQRSRHPTSIEHENQEDGAEMDHDWLSSPAKILPSRSIPTSTPPSLSPIVHSAPFPSPTVAPLTKPKAGVGIQSAWQWLAHEPLCDVSVAHGTQIPAHSDIASQSTTPKRLPSPGRCNGPRPQLDRSSPVESFHSHSTYHQKHAFLPEKLLWLKDITVGLLIDQEGFRAIQPSFKLVGYSLHSRSWKDHLSLRMENYAEEDGVVEFTPSKRESFNFHYTPLDSLPTLRRITINGNESRDYISRQASLSLKSNGVYVVCGTETACSGIAGSNGIGPNHASEPPKLKWKFEYMVDDRRLDSTGQIMDGEKTFTPLTFSCSPALLHSQQGKKVGLMHVVLKSFTPNLTAEKMDPPKLLLAARPSVSNLKATIQNTTNHYIAKSHAWVTHRRARSNVSRSEERETLMKSPSTAKAGAGNSTVQVLPESPGDHFKHHTRHRRASSAGDRIRNIAAVVIDNVIPKYPRHIIPPAELSDMLSMNVEAVPPRNHIIEYSTQHKHFG